MAQHKWHKEIKAWADGAEIESRNKLDYELYESDWELDLEPFWYEDEYEFRIRPEQSDPQYLYVYKPDSGSIIITDHRISHNSYKSNFLGKIKLEVDD